MPDYKKIFKLNIPEKGKSAKLINKYPFIRPIVILLHNRHKINLLHKKKYFDKFTRDFLHLSKPTYDNYQSLKANPPIADVFIAGSDQIWNPFHGNGLDPAFYCMFEKDINKCITYAASFGISKIPLVHEEFVKNAVKHFRSISVRETQGKKILDDFTVTSQVVVDPVFLLEKEDWISLCKRKRARNKYLLLYDFKLNDSNVEKVAKQVAKERGLKIYAIYSSPAYADKIYKNVGPIEFLELILGSDFVVSTSFHATAFSVIFEKDFYAFGQKGEGNSSRMSDLCNLVGLGNRFLHKSDEAILEETIRWEFVKKKLGEKIIESKSWLLDNITIK